MLKRKKYSEILDEWLIYQKKYVKESTYTTYFSHIEKHIKPFFKEKKINNITHEEIQGFLDNKIKNGRLDNTGGLSNKTVKDILNVIKLSIKYAMEKNYVKDFNLNFKIRPNKKKETLLNQNELNILIDYLKRKNDSYCRGILLIVCSGIRIGEICALKNEDFDLCEKKFLISKTLQRVQYIGNSKKKTKIIIQSTKTLNSTRTIPIPISYYDYLKIEKNDNYFLTQTSKYMEPRTVRYKFKKILKELNLPNVTVHSLRHSFAIQCIELGFDYNCLSEILGHSSPSTTMNIYVHSKQDFKKKCMDKFTL